MPIRLVITAALDSNDLSIVVQQKSEQDMLSIFTKDPQSVNQPNQWGQTPLHLAVGWPLGVNLLIKNGANADSLDNHGHTPLLYALDYGFAETVGLLMKAGCSLDATAFSLLERAITPCVERPRTVWGDASVEREATLTMFINSLAERRRQVYRSLATAPIPEGINPCWAQNDRVLDEHASCAEGALKYYNITPSQVSLCLPNLRTVYHVRNMTAKIAEELWQAGFHDIDVLDGNSKTPLSKRRYSDLYFARFKLFLLDKEIELMSWLVEKGASIYSPMRWLDSHSEPRVDSTVLHPERRALHHMAGNIGKIIVDLEDDTIWSQLEGCIPSLPDLLNSLSEGSTQFMATLFSNPSPDRCLCACSSGGCTALTVLEKKWAKGLGDLPDRDLELAKCLMSLLEPQNTCEDWLIDEIIRFTTFQELQLKHTCCIRDDILGNFIDPEPDEVNDFREEDSEGIELLEELMIEFRNQRGDQNLMTFLDGYWTSRMEEVRRTQGKVDLEQSREMGIVWSESSLAESRVEEI